MSEYRVVLNRSAVDLIACCMRERCANLADKIAHDIALLSFNQMQRAKGKAKSSVIREEDDASILLRKADREAELKAVEALLGQLADVLDDGCHPASVAVSSFRRS